MGYIVNDWLTCIPGTRTLWHDLLEWTGGEWVGDCEYPYLAGKIAGLAKSDWLIRNASFAGSFRSDIPTIALLQDIMPVGSYARSAQVEVCRGAALTVFNTEYTRQRYPELSGVPSRIIPLSVDFDLFRPDPSASKLYDICWIGAASEVKGFDVLAGLMAKSSLLFKVIRKDKNPIPHDTLPYVISRCRVGLCTSREETQHLAGIEMAGCGLPMVSVWPVGVYAGKEEWFEVAGERVAEVLARTVEKTRMDDWDPGEVRASAMARYSREQCKLAWLEAVAHVSKT